VAETILALQRWRGSSRILRLVEQSDASFAVEGGGRAIAKLVPGGKLTIKDGRILDEARARRPAWLKGCEIEFVLRPERFMFRRSNCRAAPLISSTAWCGRRSTA